MAEANAEDGHAAEEFLDVFDGVADWLRIAGTVGKEHTIRFEIEDVLGAGLRRDNPNIAVVIDEEAENILLDAEIVGGDTKFGLVKPSARLTHVF